MKTSRFLAAALAAASASCAPPNRFAEPAQSFSGRGASVDQTAASGSQKVDAEVKQLLGVEDAEEKKPSFDLDAALKRAGKESKNLEEYDQRLNEISAQLNYNRIGERGRMQRRFDRQNYQLSRIVASPWDLERARLQVQQSQLTEKSEYEQRVIREDGMIGVARILGRSNNTKQESSSSQ